MEEKRLRKLWGISLLIISCTALMISICNIASIELPDPVIRITGIICLLVLPVLAYSSVKLRIWKKAR